MQVGRETNILIAEKVLGKVPCDQWKILRYTELGPIFLKGECGHDACYPAGGPAHYSENISAAWEVVEKLRTRCCCVVIQCDHHYVVDCGLRFKYDSSHDAHEWDVFITADTAPLAICLAALKAVEETQK